MLAAPQAPLTTQQNQQSNIHQQLVRVPGTMSGILRLGVQSPTAHYSTRDAMVSLSHRLTQSIGMSHISPITSANTTSHSVQQSMSGIIQTPLSYTNTCVNGSTDNSAVFSTSTPFSNQSASAYLSSFADTLVTPASVSPVVSPHKYTGNNSPANDGIVSPSNTAHSSHCTFYSGFPLDSDDGQVVSKRNISQLYEHDTPPPSGINTPKLNVSNCDSVPHESVERGNDHVISADGVLCPSQIVSEASNRYLLDQNCRLPPVHMTSPNTTYPPAPPHTPPAATTDPGEINNTPILQNTSSPSDALCPNFIPDFISQPESDQHSGICVTPRSLLHHCQNNIKQRKTLTLFNKEMRSSCTMDKNVYQMML